MTLISWRSIVQNSYQSSLILIACVRHHKDLDTLKQTDEDLPVDAGFISHCNSLRAERDFPGPGGAFGWPSTLASAARRLVQQLRFSQHWHEIPLNMIYDIPLNIKWYIMGFTFHDISLNIHTRYRAPCDSNHQINVMCPHPMIFIMNKQRMSVMYTTSPNPEIPMSYIIQSEPLKIILSHWWNIAWLKTFSLFYMGFFIFQLPGNIAPEPIANQQKGITSNGSIAVQIIPISNINTQWVL